MPVSINSEVEYFSCFLDLNEADELFEELTGILETTNFCPTTEDGKIAKVGVEKIMFLDEDLITGNKFPEKYWGPTHGWTDKLKNLRERVENITNQTFQVCVLIYYPDGNSGVAYHSDLIAYGDTSIIPSISLGEEREFKLREKNSGNEASQILENGSLIIMGKHCQERYEHCLPTNPKYKRPRINLTFRKYGFDD